MALRTNALWWKDISVGQLRALLVDLPDDYRLNVGEHSRDLVIRTPEAEGLRYLGHISISSEELTLISDDDELGNGSGE